MHHRSESRPKTPEAALEPDSGEEHVSGQEARRIAKRGS